MKAGAEGKAGSAVVSNAVFDGGGEGQNMDEDDEVRNQTRGGPAVF